MYLVYGVFDMYVHIYIIINESIFGVILCALSFADCTKRQLSDL